jgi:hypothetical protein
MTNNYWKTISVVLVLVSSAFSETVFETFDSDPETRGWINTECGNTYFNYKPDGYLEAILHRDPSNVARYVKQLSQTYDAYTNPTEFWFGFDCVILPSHNGIYSESCFGVFNSGTPDNHHNAIVDQFPYRKYMTPLGNRHDIYAFHDNGSTSFEGGKPSCPWIEPGEPFRVEGRYWLEDGVRKGQISVYHIEVDGSGQTGGLIQTATKSNLVQSSLDFDVFGLCNRTSGSFGNYHNDMHVDNFYFSTEKPLSQYLADENLPDPDVSFIDTDYYAFMFETTAPEPEETVFETFSSDPLASGWQQTGSDHIYSYDQNGFVDIEFWSTPEPQRIAMPLSGTYRRDTEFWFEFDWLPQSFYMYPKAYFGVFNQYTGNERNVIAAYYMYHDSGDDREYFRLNGTSMYGSQTYDNTPEYTRPASNALHARTKLHYYLNDLDEGMLEIETWDIIHNQLLSGHSVKILEAGHEGGYDVMYNILGFANTPSDSVSRDYSDRIWADNVYFSVVGPADEYFASLGQSRPYPSWPDEDPPEPNPAQWASVPAAIKPTQISMTAQTASDFNKVEYYFNNVTDPTHDSGWQSSPVYIDMHLNDNTEYTYQVKYRDLSLNLNETAWSDQSSAVTPAETDTNPPSPDPAAWSEHPNEKVPGSIYMSAQTAADGEGSEPVQYYFANLTDPAHDSGWQYEPDFIDTGLELNTEYEYAVRVRDISANYNTTQWSDSYAIVTKPEPPISEYLRGQTFWSFSGIDQEALLRIHYINETTPPAGGEAPVIVYCMNPAMPRIGQEPDSSILPDLINDGYIVITADFYNNPQAVSPHIEEDLHEFFKEVISYGDRTSPLDGTGLVPDSDGRLWYLPEGYRIERDVTFFQTDIHGSYGTLDNIMGHWNTYVVDNYSLDPVTDPAQMYQPGGAPIDYNATFDIVYPSQTGGQKVPLVYWNGTATYRNMMTSPATRRYHFAGFVMRGYAWANPAHCFDPLVYWYGAFPASEMDWWNGLKHNSAFIRYIHKHADEYNIDSSLIGGWGHSKGQYGITRLSDPNNASGQELRPSFTGFPEGSPEPQPNTGYPSTITCGYQSMGLGDDHPEFVTADYVPTLTVCGDRDDYGHYEPDRWPKLVEKLEEMDVPHTAFLMYDVGHDLPTGYDPVLGIDRYLVCVDFFDRYLKPGLLPPVPLIIKPRDQRTDVLPTEPVWINFAPIIDSDTVLTDDAIKVYKTSDMSQIPGTWTRLNGGTTYNFVPAAGKFEAGQSYRIVITGGVKDVHGTPVAHPVETVFTTISIIDSQELTEFATDWLETVDAGHKYDYDQNLKIDFLDFSMFAQNWLNPE